MIISIHMPKTAGSSFGVILKEKFGENIKYDYGFLPLESNLFNRILISSYLRAKVYRQFNNTNHFNNIECIHGHFMPFRFGFLLNKKNVNFITWLRDPIEHLISGYNHYKYREPHNMYALFHRKFQHNNWSLEEFCFRKEVQNYYTKYFWRFPVEKFSFIGITEHFSEDCKYFTQEFLGLNIDQVPFENITSPEKKNNLDNPNLVKKLKEFHKKDYELYNCALNLRQKRLSRN